MGLSVLCLLHCLALPWLLASLPAVALAALPEALRDNEWLHVALIAPVLLVSGPVLLRGGPSGLLRSALVVSAFAALISALLLGDEIGKQALTVAGAALLMAAHWERLRQAHPH